MDYNVLKGSTVVCLMIFLSVSYTIISIAFFVSYSSSYTRFASCLTSIIVGPRLAKDHVPDIIPAGTVVVPSHVSTICGQKIIKLSAEEQNRIAEPRLANFNKSAYMTETMGGPKATRHEKHADGKIHQFPDIQTEGMEGSWKPWSVCHSAPEWIIGQSGDKKSILRKIEREKREKKPVQYCGFNGHVNPWTVSKQSPAWIEGHMQQYDPESILSRNKEVPRARRCFENSDVLLSQNMKNVLNGQPW